MMTLSLSKDWAKAQQGGYFATRDLPASLQRIVRTRKHSVYVTCARRVRLSSYWSEGSRESWSAARIADGVLIALPTHGGAPQFGGTIVDYEIAPGTAVVCTGISRGKPARPVLYIDWTDWLDVVSAELARRNDHAAVVAIDAAMEAGTSA